jgi:hypothetical protein
MGLITWVVIWATATPMSAPATMSPGSQVPVAVGDRTSHRIVNATLFSEVTDAIGAATATQGQRWVPGRVPTCVPTDTPTTTKAPTNSGLSRVPLPGFEHGEIVHELERQGIPTARGLEKWTRSGVRQVVQRAEREAGR